MKLFYGTNSPYARKVRVVLAERGIDCEMAPIDVNDPPEEFASANPNWRVPCLLDGGRALFESNLVVDYLLQTYPARGGGHADPPLADALTRPEHHWDDGLLLQSIEGAIDSGILLFQLQRIGTTPEQEPYLERQRGRIGAILQWLEARVTPEGFVPGVLSIQDLNAAILLQWLDFRQPVAWRGQYPRLEALVARYENRPSFRATQPGG